MSPVDRSSWRGGTDARTRSRTSRPHAAQSRGQRTIALAAVLLSMILGGCDSDPVDPAEDADFYADLSLAGGTDLGR